MFCNFRRIWNPTEGEKKSDEEFNRKIFDDCVKEQGCSVCIHCKRVRHDDCGLCTAEDYDCEAGLKCDTVFFTVKNCPNFESREYIPKYKKYAKNNKNM